MTSEGHLGQVVRRLLAARGWSSPEKLTKSYLPDAPPMSAAVIRRIISGEQDGLEDKLTQLSVMLKLPLQTLGMVQDGDRKGVERLPFRDDDEDVKQFILDTMNPPRKRAAQ